MSASRSGADIVGTGSFRIRPGRCPGSDCSRGSGEGYTDALPRLVVLALPHCTSLQPSRSGGRRSPLLVRLGWGNARPRPLVGPAAVLSLGPVLPELTDVATVDPSAAVVQQVALPYFERLGIRRGVRLQFAQTRAVVHPSYREFVARDLMRTCSHILGSAQCCVFWIALVIARNT